MLTIVKIFHKAITSALRQRVVRLSILLTLGVIFLSTLALFINVRGKTYRYGVGDIAREDVRVPGEVVYEIERESELEKVRAAERAPLVFDKDGRVLIEKLAGLDVLFDNVISVLREFPPQGSEERTFQFLTVKSRLPKYVRIDDKPLYNLLRYSNLPEMKQSAKKILINIMEGGVLDSAYSNPLALSNRSVLVRTINELQDTTEAPGALEDLKTYETVMKDLYGQVQAVAPHLSREELATMAGIASGFIKPNLTFNADETRRKIDEAVKSAKPITGSMKKGQTIVREGDTITPDALKKISILNTYTASTRISYLGGVLILQLSFLVIFGYFLFQFHSNLLPDFKTPVVVFSMVVVFIVYTFFLSRVDNILNSKFIFSLYLPIPAITMIIATLFNMFIAIIIGMYLIFFSFAISGGSLPVIVLAFSSAMLGVFVLTDVEKRTDFLRGGLVLGIVNAVVAVGVCLMEEYTLSETLQNVELALASGIVNSILVLGVFPVFENLFDITTKFNLLELSDLNAPIFKRLLIKAPGTYNHSLMVATMAESACKDIHADYMLARVGGYYHDIGKIEDAGIYIENKITDKKAKNLSPGEYSRLIISHVEKGVELAHKRRLPSQIVDFIKEHHGKTTMTYFYHQALESADTSGSAEEIDKADFQYPGPRPHSRETAVVMLADAVEAASRSLQEPTYVKLESLVKKIIYNKLNEDELEYSDLTMQDLTKVHKAFMRVLNGIFHTRIEYPDKEDVEKLEHRVINGKNGD